jgi:hypothetical protein
MNRKIRSSELAGIQEFQNFSEGDPSSHHPSEYVLR